MNSKKIKTGFGILLVLVLVLFTIILLQYPKSAIKNNAVEIDRKNNMIYSYFIDTLQVLKFPAIKNADSTDFVLLNINKYKFVKTKKFVYKADSLIKIINSKNPDINLDTNSFKSWVVFMKSDTIHIGNTAPVLSKNDTFSFIQKNFKNILLGILLAILLIAIGLFALVSTTLNKDNKKRPSQTNDESSKTEVEQESNIQYKDSLKNTDLKEYHINFSESFVEILKSYSGELKESISDIKKYYDKSFENTNNMFFDDLNNAINKEEKLAKDLENLLKNEYTFENIEKIEFEGLRKALEENLKKLEKGKQNEELDMFFQKVYDKYKRLYSDIADYSYPLEKAQHRELLELLLGFSFKMHDYLLISNNYTNLMDSSYCNIKLADKTITIDSLNKCNYKAYNSDTFNTHRTYHIMYDFFKKLKLKKFDNAFVFGMYFDKIKSNKL